MSLQAIRLAPGERWDDWISFSSNPIRSLMRASENVSPVTRIEIPRRCWAVLLRHPRVMSDYAGLRFEMTESKPCPTCGTVRAAVRPFLDSQTVDYLLMANADGPILPRSVVLVDREDNAVTLHGARGVFRVENIYDETAVPQ